MDSFSTKITLKDIKKIAEDSILNLDKSETWMITWIDRIFFVSDKNAFFSACVHRVKTIDKIVHELNDLEFKHPKTITLPLRLLRIYPVGTIFNNGETLFKAHLSLIKTYILDLDSSQSHEHLKLGDWKYGQELINQLAFNKIKIRILYEFGSNSKVKVFKNRRSEVANYDYIVIRTLEISRFYWFPSTRVTKLMLEGAGNGIKDEKFFIKDSAKQVNVDGQIHHEILLNDNMHLRDHPYIARLAFDKDALLSANIIYQSAFNSKNTFNSFSSIHLDGTFPFNSETTLTVKAFIVSCPSCKVLLVTELLSCCGPWPFEILHYDRNTEQGVVDNELKPEETNNVPNETPKIPNSDPDDIDIEDVFENTYYNPKNPLLPKKPKFDSDLKNNSNIKNLELTLTESKFPSLTKERKRMYRTRPVNPKIEKGFDGLPIDNVSTNEDIQKGGSSTNIDIVSKEKDIKPDKIKTEEFIMTLVWYYRKEKAIVEYVVNGSEKFHKDFTITSIYEKEKLKLYILRIRMKSYDFILIELDRLYGSSLKLITKKEGHIKTFDETDIDDIFLSLNENYKTLSTLDKKKYRVQFIYHVEKCTPKMYKDRINQKVKPNDESLT